MSQDIVIVGGGVIGSAIACFTLGDPAFRGTVTVVERDPSYARASSALSASSIRQQFSTAVNIEIGRFGIEFLRRIGEYLTVDGERPEIGLVEHGYLYLASADGAAILERNHALQRAHGVDVALLTPGALRERFPWLATDGVAAGVARPVGRGMVRRLQPDAGVPAQGALARRDATSMPKDAASTSKGHASWRCASPTGRDCGATRS